MEMSTGNDMRLRLEQTNIRNNNNMNFLQRGIPKEIRISDEKEKMLKKMKNMKKYQLKYLEETNWMFEHNQQLMPQDHFNCFL